MVPTPLLILRTGCPEAARKFGNVHEPSRTCTWCPSISTVRTDRAMAPSPGDSDCCEEVSGSATPPTGGPGVRGIRELREAPRSGRRPYDGLHQSLLLRGRMVRPPRRGYLWDWQASVAAARAGPAAYRMARSLLLHGWAPYRTRSADVNFRCEDLRTCTLLYRFCMDVTLDVIFACKFSQM